VDVKQFVQQYEGKSGKLDRWEAEIFLLYRAQVSYEKIADFLRMHAVQVSKIEVYRYIHRNKRRHLLQGAPAARQPNVAPAGMPDSATAVQQETPCSDAFTTDEASSQAQGSTLPRFSWLQSRTKDKPKW